jgi:hypothetical protein
MSFNKTTFLNKSDIATTVDCTTWSNVNYFWSQWPDTDFQRVSIYTNNWIYLWWNSFAAIKLLIQRCNYLESLIGGGGNMDSILTSMLSATPEQLTKFIGIVDAYRQAIWDAPFNEDFYAALANGFRFWNGT